MRSDPLLILFTVFIFLQEPQQEVTTTSREESGTAEQLYAQIDPPQKGILREKLEN